MVIYIISLIVFLILCTAGIVLIFYKQNEGKDKKHFIRKIAMLGIFGALSTILYFIKFPLPIFVSFLKIQFSNIPVLLGSFMFGPLEGIVVALIRTMIKLPFSDTLCVGELQDLIISIAISCITGIIYKKKSTKKNAIISLVLASIAWTIISVISNAFVSIPLYIKFMFDGNEQVLIDAIAVVIKDVNNENYMIKYLMLSCLPFNILLSTVVSLVTFLVYKRTSNLYKNKIDND